MVHARSRNTSLPRCPPARVVAVFGVAVVVATTAVACGGAPGGDAAGEIDTVAAAAGAAGPAPGSSDVSSPDRSAEMSAEGPAETAPVPDTTGVSVAPGEEVEPPAEPPGDGAPVESAVPSPPAVASITTTSAGVAAEPRVGTSEEVGAAVEPELESAPDDAKSEVAGTGPAVDLSEDVPDLAMTDLSSGSTVSLRSVVTGSTPLLLWFWSPL